MVRILLATIVLGFNALASAETITIYSYRQPDLIAPILEIFEAETKYTIETVFLQKGVIERVQAEGKNSPVDIFLTTDIGRLIALTEAGITQAISNDTINNHIPAQYRDDAGHWYSLTQRGRVFYVAKDLENPPMTYEDLANPDYADMICLRDGQHAYNNALFASFVAHLGEAAAIDLLKGIRDNLARSPQGNDRAQAKGIFSGECLIGIGNSYYVGLMMTNEEEPEQQDWAAALDVILPNSEGRGTHMNISGMAMAINSPNPIGARALMEFLASDTIQEAYAEIVHEYPVSPTAEPSQLVKQFGQLTPDNLALSEIAAHRTRASEIIDEIGFNN